MFKPIGILHIGQMLESGGSSTQYIQSLELGEQGISINTWNSFVWQEKAKNYAEYIISATNSHEQLTEDKAALLSALQDAYLELKGLNANPTLLEYINAAIVASL